MSRSIKLIWLIALLVVLVGGATVLGLARPKGAARAPDGGRITSLEQWVELTRRPNLQLLDSADLPDYLVCVYRDVGSAEVVLCYRWKHAQAGPATRAFAVKDSDGRMLQDRSRVNSTTDLNPVGSIPAHRYIDGMVVPIPEEYRGEIRVELKDSSGSELPTRTVYAKTLRIGAEELDR